MVGKEYQRYLQSWALCASWEWGQAESRLRHGCKELETSLAAHDSPGRLKYSPGPWAGWGSPSEALKAATPVSTLRTLRAASLPSNLYWKPVLQIWSWHPECHPESSRGSQQEYTALHQANGSAREGSAPAPCRCAAHRQDGSADSCT